MSWQNILKKPSKKTEEEEEVEKILPVARTAVAAASVLSGDDE